jgi:hypothetical protein
VKTRSPGTGLESPELESVFRTVHISINIKIPLQCMLRTEHIRFVYSASSELYTFPDIEDSFIAQLSHLGHWENILVCVQNGTLFPI